MSANNHKKSIQGFMQAIRIHEPGGPLHVDQVKVPEPGPGEVLVKMAAAPINPSDLALLTGKYLPRNYPFTPGLEGSGVVVSHGSGWLGKLRQGKRVACSPKHMGDGTWAEFMVTGAKRTIPLPKPVSLNQGSMMLVNPMTAMAFIQIAREGKHQAMVNTAANSSLGRMMVGLCREFQIPLINIVRSEAHLDALKDLGAEWVLNSESSDFPDILSELAQKLKASLWLDAVTGSMTGDLLRAAPKGTTILAYARLSGQPITMEPAHLIRKDITLQGFQLGNWLSQKSLITTLRTVKQVGSRLGGVLSSQIRETTAFSGVEEAIHRYEAEMSLGKILLVPEP